MSTWFPDEFSQQIFNTKYAGVYQDNPYLYFYDLAREVAFGDHDLQMFFFDIMYHKRFAPGGRILAYAGRRTSQVSMMNCTTHKVMGDTLEDISETTYAIMRASSRGQGIGIDLSQLRPANSPVNNAAISSTGSISFMEMFNKAGSIIGQQGRRGALLFSLSVDHPDIYRPDLIVDGHQYDFLNIKKIPGRVESANISIRITDKFLYAVHDDGMWTLEYSGKSGGFPFHVKTEYPARVIFDEIAKSAWSSAEPGLLYWDTSREMSNSDLFGEKWRVVGLNACTEQVLDQDGVCNLGSMNLAAYVLNPFTPKAEFNFGLFERDIATAVRFLDNVLSLELKRGIHTGERQRESIINLRRIGLGMMGVADMFAMMGILYGSKESEKLLEKVMRVMRDQSYLTSIKLAKEFGPALVWRDSEDYWDSISEKGFFGTLPPYIQKEIKNHGTRNVTLLSVAPTGSISNLFGVSGGIEPLFARSFTRRHRLNGRDEFVDYIHPGVRKSRIMNFPDSIWPTAYEVTPQQHILMQAIAQEYVDASISKTLNFPASATWEDVGDAYLRGWDHGLKGMAVYRDGSRHEQILYTDVQNDEQTDSGKCPECSQPLVFESGCASCYSCGYSLCLV